MVLEVAILDVRAGRSGDFEKAFREAQAILAASPGYQRHELRRCVEASERYLLLVWWDDLESHTERFRSSEGYRRWSALLHPFYDPFPTVEHYLPVSGAGGAEPSALRVADAAGSATLDYAGALAAHGGDSVFGVAVGFRMLQAAAQAIGPGGALRRDTLHVRSAHSGPGVRDAVEYVTGCVSQGRYRVEAGDGEPGCRRSMRFEWEVRDGGLAAALRLREGFVPEEFHALLDRRGTADEGSGDAARLAALKTELAEAVWREPLADLFEVELRATA